MKYLFIARQFTQFRNYDSVLRELASRDHRIHLAVEKTDGFGGERAVRTLAAAHPEITFGFAPDRQQDEWSDMARRLRLGLDYLRYLDPFYDTATLRRERARLRTPRLLAALADPPAFGGAAWRRTFGTALHRLDRTVPPPAAIVEFVREHAPDALLITPLVELGSQQIDYVRAARQLGIPCGLAVWSWDHLTSKALLREYPERVFVWNDMQRAEAVDAHGVPPDRIVVTGAQCFDHWFERQPTRTRAELCAELGLIPDRPIVLYVCSGLIMGSPREVDFVREWLQWVRSSSNPALAAANVLIRPHPQQAGQWEGFEAGGLGPLAIWGANPIDEQTRRDYFDSLCHSDAVVGLNTSAFLEAAIAGKEVLAILVPRFHDNQDGTAHFRYLRQVGGGLLRVANDRGSHLSQLEAALGLPRTPDHPHRAFLESFIRPRGLDCAATPVLVQAIEELPLLRGAVGASANAAERNRVAMAKALRMAFWLAGESAMLSPRELEPARRSAEHRRRRERQAKAKGRDERERARRRARRWKAARRFGHHATVRVKTAARQALVASGLLRNLNTRAPGKHSS